MNITNMSFFRQLSTMAICLSLNVTAIAQLFPTTSTTSPAGDQLNIPDDLKGKKSIVFLAFTKQAEAVLDDWYAPVYTMFIDQSGFNAMAYDCHVKLVMMFTGLGQGMAQQVMAKVRENIDEEMNNYLLFYEGPFKLQMEALNITKKDDAYVIVLDENGEVIYTASGKYSESKLDKIAELVEL